ncbi:unnamed protein product, partial [Prorocentrum cordatum]
LEMWRAFQNSLLMLTCVVFVEFMALCDAAPRAVQEEGVVRRKGRRSEKSERERERQAEDEACLRATRAHGGGTGSPLWPAVSRRLAAGGTQREGESGGGGTWRGRGVDKTAENRRERPTEPGTSNLPVAQGRLRATAPPSHGWSASGARRQLPTTCTRDRPRGARAPRKLAC